eukprot:5783532-Ditylum_brightwellii.AAC.1
MNNMLYKKCVVQDSAETKESLCVIVPPEYHDRIEKLFDVNKQGDLGMGICQHGCASDFKICCEDGHKYNCDAKSRPV